MIFPWPDLVNHLRKVTTYGADHLEVAAAPTTVESNVKCWIIRPGSGTDQTAFGLAETANDMILIEPYNSSDGLRVVRRGDSFKDTATDDIWNAVGPGTPVRQPSSFVNVTAKYSHIEVPVVRADIEAAGVHPTDIVEP